MERAEFDCVIDVDQELATLRMKMEKRTQRKHWRIERRTIFKVPDNMRKADRGAYDPKIVSIGPYHRSKKHLKAMNDLKFRYLRRILFRNRTISLVDYLTKIRELEAKARSSYSEDINMKSKDFVEMMLLDGCFIVELLLMQKDRNKEGIRGEEQEEDPTLSTTWALDQIQLDMQMLENQLPFFILENLFNLATAVPDRDNSDSLIKHTLDFFDNQLPERPTEGLIGENVPTVCHILHLLHSCIMLARPCQPTPEHNIPDSVPSATVLEEAGVKFKRKENPKSLLDVTFGKGVMEIPLLPLYDHTNTFFRNLIAFEQCYPEVGTSVQNYAVLMDCLIDTANDVALLHRHKCIKNCLGDDNGAADLFNRLCKGVPTIDSDSYLSSLFKEVDNHCKVKCNKWRAKLLHDYFSNPWSALSLAGALILILLTVIQTVFAVLGYFRPPT